MATPQLVLSHVLHCTYPPPALQPARSEGCDDACVVTMVVATRGHIDVPRQ
jgi:hypothetical protein